MLSVARQACSSAHPEQQGSLANGQVPRIQVDRVMPLRELPLALADGNVLALRASGWYRCRPDTQLDTSGAARYAAATHPRVCRRSIALVT
jgi:hypothetical protein